MESKFKVGDRVKIIGKDCANNSEFIGVYASIDYNTGIGGAWRLNGFDNQYHQDHVAAFRESSLQLSSESGTTTTATTKHHRRIPLNMEV